MGTPGRRGHGVAAVSRACFFDSGSIQMSASRKEGPRRDGVRIKRIRPAKTEQLEHLTCGLLY